MVRKYLFGEPFETFAVTAEVPVSTEEIPYLTLERKVTDGVKSLCFSTPLADGEIVYGLGETLHGIDKRGYRYIMFNTDDPTHRDEMMSLYGAHNFVVIDGERHFGLFFDTPARTAFVHPGLLLADEDIAAIRRLQSGKGSELQQQTLAKLAADGKSFRVPPKAASSGMNLI